MEAPDRLLAQWLAAVAPTGTAVAAGPIAPAIAFDEDEAATVAAAVARRRDEFLTGRALARRALAELGCPPTAIPVGEGRMPIWPDPYVGSISHCDGLCVAHVARRRDLVGIGVDVERARALSPDLIANISSPEEWDRLAKGQTPEIDAGTLCFSAKEAVYKAYFPAARTFLGFSDVFLEVDWAREAFAASLAADDKPDVAGRRRIEGRFARIGGYLATAVWIAR